MVSIGSPTRAFQRTHYWTPKVQDGWDPPSWKSTLRHFSAEGGPIWIKFRRLVQNDMSTAVIWSKSKPDLEFQYRGHLGEFHGMSSQSHMPHCRVQSPGEINSWSCHTVRCKNSIRHIENRFRHILFLLFLMQFGLWRAAAFVSSPIHLGWYGQVLGVCQEFSARWRTGAAGPGTGLAPDFCISAWDIWRSYGRISMKFYVSQITEKRVHGFALMLRVDGCRNMDELINFWAQSGL